MIQSFWKAFSLSFRFPIPLAPPLQVWQGLGAGANILPPRGWLQCRGWKDWGGQPNSLEQNNNVHWVMWAWHVAFSCKKEGSESLHSNTQGLNPLLTPLDEAASCTTQALWELIGTLHFNLQVLWDSFNISHPFPFIKQKEPPRKQPYSLSQNRCPRETRLRGTEEAASQTAPLILNLLLNFSLDLFFNFRNPGIEPFSLRTWVGNKELLNYTIWFCLKPGIHKTASTFPC